jgi:hypothetical protein
MSMNPEPRTKLPIAALLLCGGLVAAFVAVAAVARGDEPDLTEPVQARRSNLQDPRGTNTGSHGREVMRSGFGLAT